MAAVDLFLKIDGIPGDSQDSKHKGEIQLESFSWGEAQMQGPSGEAKGRVQFEDFHFAMPISRASPPLLLACASGQHIKLAVLIGRRPGGQQQEFLKYTFSDVLVSSYRSAASEQPPGVVDQVSFNFGRIDVEFRPQKSDGTLDAPVKASWDVRANRPGA